MLIAILRSAAALLLGTALVSVPVQAAPSGPAIKIGLNYPASGRYKEEGLAQVRGAMMALEEINASNGVMGRPLELLTANTVSEPERAVENVKELAAQGAAMLFGGSSSAVAIAAGKEAARHKLIYFGTLTYANETTGADGHRHMFRETYNAHMAAKALSAYLNESLKGKRLFYLTADYNWGWSTESSMRESTGTADTSAHPGTLVPYPRPRESDMRSALQRAEESGADVLVVVQFGDDMSLALHVARAMDLHKKMTIIVPSLTLAMAKTAGPGVMQDVIGTVPWTWQVPYAFDHARGKAFVESYVKKYNSYPTSSAASAYSIVYQFKDAVERTRSLDSDKLIKALEGHKYSLLKDEQEWRAMDHQNVQSTYVVRIRPRMDILKSHLREDYFEILTRMDGEAVAATREEWLDERRKAGAPLTLQ